jgi:hypothetical protein
LKLKAAARKLGSRTRIELMRLGNDHFMIMRRSTRTNGGFREPLLVQLERRTDTELPFHERGTRENDHCMAIFAATCSDKGHFTAFIRSIRTKYG